MTRLLGSSFLHVHSTNIYASLISKQACAVVRHQSKKCLLTLGVRPSSGCFSPFAVSSFLSYLAFSSETPDTSVTKILALCTLHVSLHLRRFHRKWYFLSKLPYNGFPSCLKSFYEKSLTNIPFKKLSKSVSNFLP